MEKSILSSREQCFNLITALAKTQNSPEMIMFGHPVKDFNLILPGKYKPHNMWVETHEHFKVTLAKRSLAMCQTTSRAYT